MLDYVRGRLEERGADWTVIDVHGLGLRVELPASTLAALPSPGEEVRLWTHLFIREDLRVLYGFLQLEERALFHALLTVNKVGPKVALALLSALPVAQLAGIIQSGDAGALSRIRGVGTQTAAQIVLKLQGKLPPLVPVGEGSSPVTPATGGRAPFLPVGDGDALEGLLGLGLTRAEATSLLATLPPDPTRSTDATLLLALQARGTTGRS